VVISSSAANGSPISKFGIGDQRTASETDLSLRTVAGIAFGKIRSPTCVSALADSPRPLPRQEVAASRAGSDTFSRTMAHGISVGILEKRSRGVATLRFERPVRTSTVPASWHAARDQE